MTYIGSKKEIATQIVQLITKNLQPGGDYIEPFCGGCAVAEALPPLTYNTYLSDNNPYLIALLQKCQQGYKPPINPITKEEYLRVKKTMHSKDQDCALIGEYGHLYGFRGSFYTGFCAIEKGINYYIRKRTGLLDTVAKIKQAKIQHLDYQEYPLHNHNPENTLVYCDIPYINTRTDGYANAKGFNHNTFWEWVRQNSLKGYKIVVSELEAPQDFTPIVKIPHKHILSQTPTKQTTVDRTECLFVYNETVSKWKYKTKMRIGLIDG